MAQLFLAIGQEPGLKITPLQLYQIFSLHRCINCGNLFIREPSRVNFRDNLILICLVFFGKKRALLRVDLEYIRHHVWSQRLFATVSAAHVP